MSSNAHSPTATPTSSHSPVLTPEDELAALMNVPATPVGQDNNLQGSADADLDLDASFGAVRNELAFARRLAAQNKLHPYQRQGVEDLVKADDALKFVMLYVLGCAIENKLDRIITAAPAYEISDALKKNIKSVVVAVLLSPKLAAYKGEGPKEAVLKILLSDKLHIPANYETDSFVSETIAVAIGEELTQTRAKIVAATKTKLKLFDLASKVVAGTRCSVTVPLCGKLALIRKVHEEKDGANNGMFFWDAVDVRLELIRKLAEGDQAKVSRVFQGYLDQDQQQYGANPANGVASEEQNAWQQRIDDVLAV